MARGLRLVMGLMREITTIASLTAKNRVCSSKNKGVDQSTVG